jgi:HK97 gp10 family phage protein
VFRVELKGLAAVKDNFEQLNDEVQNKIGRDSLRYFSWLIAKPMRTATYTTFSKQTGAIRRGLAVAVQFEPVQGKLKSWVVEYPQQITGAETPFKALVRRRVGRRRTRQVATTSTAYWWRFLEFGTGPRRARRTVKVNPLSKRYASQLLAAAKQKQSPSRGAIRPRTWLRPAYGATATDALSKFRDYFLKLVDAAVSAMPK